MNPSIIRGLGIGLFIAGVLFTFLPTSNPTLENTPKGYEIIESSKLTKLEEELSTSKEQLAQIQLDLENMSNAETDRENESEDESTVESPSITNTVLEIRKGMNSIDVSLTLEETGILKDRKDLDQYLEDNKLSERIQIGTYELDSTMTIAEIADLITK